MAKTYRFPYVKDSDGYPKIEREMSREEYAAYSDNLAALRRNLLKYRSIDNCTMSTQKTIACDYNRLYQEKQNTAHNWSLAYPTQGFPERTIGSSGIFQVVTLMVLKYFYVTDVTIENLRDIAIFGDWHHRNGTWHHFIDVVCESYGIETTRISKFSHIMHWMENGGLCTALLDNSTFPGTLGNCLVVITAISTEENFVEYYFPGGHPETEHFRKDSIVDFMRKVKVLWGFFIN